VCEGGIGIEPVGWFDLGGTIGRLVRIRLL